MRSALGSCLLASLRGRAFRLQVKTQEKPSEITGDSFALPGTEQKRMPTVDEAIKAYFTERETELSDSSLQNHHYQLKQFSEWAGGAGDVSSVEELEPLDLSRFRRYRSKSINTNTMYNQLCVVRLFLRFCFRMGWVDESLPESIVLPTRDGAARDSKIDPDRVAGLLDDLERYQYASTDHVILSLLWSCSLRIGGLRALDVSDVDLDNRWADLVYRPESETPLKNKRGSEREINLHGWVCDLLRAWIKDRRPSVTDEYGRKPLLATKHGRMSRSAIRIRVYKLTACGNLGQGCDCGSTYPAECDDSVAPHDIRRSSISAWLNEGHDPNLLSGRVDTSTRTMEKHYDVRSEREKRELRRDAFDL